GAGRDHRPVSGEESLRQTHVGGRPRLSTRRDGTARCLDEGRSARLVGVAQSLPGSSGRRAGGSGALVPRAPPLTPTAPTTCFPAPRVMPMLPSLSAPRPLVPQPEPLSHASLPVFRVIGDRPKNLLERALSVFADVRAGEGVTTLLMTVNVFLLLA